MKPNDVQDWAIANPPRWSAPLLFLAVVLATLVLGFRESWESDHEHGLSKPHQVVKS